MIKLTNWIVNIILLLLSIITPVYASNQSGAVELIPGVGIYFFSPNRQYQNTAFPNISMGYYFTNNWSIMLMGGLMNTQANNSRQSIQGNLLNLDAAYHFTNDTAIQPYLFIGPGILNLSPNDNYFSRQAVLNFGGGLKFFVARTIALQGDIRDIIPTTGGKNDILANFGVSLLFGI